MIDPQHPEATCQACGRRNVVWHAESPLWNRVNGSENGILCPTCFAQRADEQGVGVGSWKLIIDPSFSLEGGSNALHRQAQAQ